MLIVDLQVDHHVRLVTAFCLELLNRLIKGCRSHKCFLISFGALTLLFSLGLLKLRTLQVIVKLDVFGLESLKLLLR